MKRYGHQHIVVGLLVVMALLATGCASGGTYYGSPPAPVYGYYSGYGAGYYHNDVIVTRPPSQPPAAASPSPPGQASQLPARSVPRPAPRRR